MPEVKSPQTPLADAAPVTVADGRPPDRPGPSLGGPLDGAKDLGRLELIALLRADQRQRWQLGQRVPAEVYLQEVPTLRDDPELAIDLVFSEFVLRRDVLGEAPDLDEYLARFPQHATALRQQHELEALWRESARTQGGPGPAPATATPPPGAADWTVLEGGTGATAAAPGVPSLPGYEVLGELGRGGMGLVLRGHDLHLGRDLAIKLLRPEFQGQPHLVRRFLNEARTCGRLQHPGIVPIYDLGALPDRRPFFTMKLVEGRTLADLLDERADPAQDWPRLLSICEQVSQALAYAHSKGVIHRDLKPENIMVGAFGEVQVMDWGLAKFLSRGGDDPPAPAPSGVDRWLLTQSGGALGTLPYMPPEQARGEVERMDQRCDVFGLGAILCEVLTGRPPFDGRDGAELLARARACDHGEALARLDACGADGELVRLAKGCLAAEPADRPRDAGAVAGELTAYLAGVQERLRAAELERAAAQARADEARATAAAERRARRRARGLVAAGLLIALLGAGGWFGWERQQAEKGRQRAEQERAVTENLELVARSLQTWKMREATAGMRLAEQAANGGPDELGRRVRQMQDHLALVDRLDRLRAESAIMAEGEMIDPSTDWDYAALFHEEGFASEGDGAEVVAARLRDSVLREQLVAALDDWAAATENKARRAWLLEAARRAQPGEWSDRFRKPERWEDPVALEELARAADVKALSPQMLTVLGRALQRAKADSVPFLTRAQECHADDFWLNLLLGNSLLKARPQEAEGYYRAAMAIRQRTSVVSNNLGAALFASGRPVEAVAALRQAAVLAPTSARVHSNLGAALQAMGEVDLGIDEYNEALRLDPSFVSAHSNLGIALKAKGQWARAIEECHTATTLAPDHANGHYNLGVVLQAAGRLDEAIAAYRQATILDRTYASAHNNLGNVLNERGQPDEAIKELQTAIALNSKDAAAHTNLGNALSAVGRLDEAIVEHRTAIALDPKDATAHTNLGNALRAAGRLDAALAEHREALALDPGFAKAHCNLGSVLVVKGQVDEGRREFRKGIALDPTLTTSAHFNLATALDATGRTDAAIDEYRLVIARDANHAEAHRGLGDGLQRKGRFEEAIEEYRTAIKLGPKSALAHYHLGVALEARGQTERALEEYERAIALDRKCVPARNARGASLNNKGRIDEALRELNEALALDAKYAPVHYNLGRALLAKGRLAEAVEEHRQATVLAPDSAKARGGLGEALLRQGRFADAKEATRRCLALLPDNDPLRGVAASQLARCEMLLALEEKLPAILRGDAEPAGIGERLTLASICQTFKQRYALSARLYAEVLAEQPRLADDLRAPLRYNAACAAALAGCGKGQDAQTLPDKVTQALRQQALTWLRADLACWTKQPNRAAVRERMQHWQTDADLAGVRDLEGLEKLPEVEREEWRKLWDDVAALLKGAGAAP